MADLLVDTILRQKASTRMTNQWCMSRHHNFIHCTSSMQKGFSKVLTLKSDMVQDVFVINTHIADYPYFKKH